MPQNDVGILAESKLLITLEQCAIQPGSDEGDLPEHCFFQIYSDLEYGVSPVMVSPFSGVGELTAAQQEWNVTMGQVQILVEHGFQPHPFRDPVVNRREYSFRSQSESCRSYVLYERRNRQCKNLRAIL